LLHREGWCTIVHTNNPEFEWDLEKEQSNRKKHGVRFADAATIFEDEPARVMDDENPFEQRFTALGRAANGEILVVVFTWRGERAHLISARRANRWEREQYQEAI
jgi:uncharacterized DUF497 family protein